jgi:hypothetical protein
MYPSVSSACKNGRGMDLFVCWLVAPVGLLAATVGLALLLERLSGLALPWAMRPALGLAVAIVLAQLGTATAFTAKLTLAAILLLGFAGLWVGRGGLRRRPGRAEVAVAAVVFALYASPFLAIGEATLAGYIKLEDTATWLAIADHVFSLGRGELGALAPSTHQQVLVDYLGGSYPIGGFVPMALMSKLTGEDVAFTIQPSMAFAAAALALLLFELARRLVRGAGPSAAIAVLSSLSALLVGYYLWGGVKELVAAALLPLAPLLAGRAAAAGWPRFAWAPLGVAVAAMVVVLGPGGAVWVVPTLLPAAVAALRGFGARRAWRIAWPIGAFSLLLVLPVVFTPTGIFDPLNEGVTGASQLGNLDAPLNFFQVAGIWPSIDFRFHPHLRPETISLATICLLFAGLGALLAARRGEADGVPLVGYLAGGALGALFIAHFGSPWVDGKVMATLSPAILAAALIGAAMLARRPSLGPAMGLFAALVLAGVAWSAFLAYQGVWFAPRSHFAELQAIGERFAGQGPALSTEPSIYGPRHFLRRLDAEGANDRRHNPIALVGGGEPEDGGYVDLDQILPGELDRYRLIVVRRSAAESRPPADFGLAYRTAHYDVWRRGPAPGTPVAHLPLGTELDAGNIPVCADVRRLAGEAGPGGKLIAARVGTAIAIEFHQGSLPPGWNAPSPYTFTPSGSGAFTERFSVPGGGYELWLGGVVFGGLTLRIDGAAVASERATIDDGGVYEPLAVVHLAPGEHTLGVEYEGASLSPGSAVFDWAIGPLVLEAPAEHGDLGLLTVAPREYRRLCGRLWDWVEAYRR